MKHLGSKFEYEKERNEDLMRTYEEYVLKGSYINMRDIFREVIKHKASRFWVSDERAAIVIGKMLKGDRLLNMRKTKREMFREIFVRVQSIRTESPGITIHESVSEAIRQPAPRFYLTEGSAKVIIYKIKKAWYEKRKKRLSFMLQMRKI